MVTCYTAIITVQVTMDIQLLDTLRNAPLEFVDVIEYYMPFPSGILSFYFFIFGIFYLLLFYFSVFWL